MSDEQHKARLKHAAEVLGWLAEGKTLQGRRPVVGADWEDLPPDEEENWNEPGAVGAILAELWEYRVKPEPVAKELFVLRDPFGDPVIDLRHTGFVIGDKVRVTKIED